MSLQVAKGGEERTLEGSLLSITCESGFSGSTVLFRAFASLALGSESSPPGMVTTQRFSSITPFTSTFTLLQEDDFLGGGGGGILGRDRGSANDSTEKTSTTVFLPDDGFNRNLMVSWNNGVAFPDTERSLRLRRKVVPLDNSDQDKQFHHYLNRTYCT